MDGLHLVTDDRFAHVGRRERDKLRHAHDDEDASALRTRLVQIEREARNSEGGYFIAADAPVAGGRALAYEVPCHQLRALVLASDGAAAGPGRHLVPASWSVLLTGATPAVDLLHDIERAEKSDPDRTRWPRSKPSDDKALIRVRASAQDR